MTSQKAVAEQLAQLTNTIHELRNEIANAKTDIDEIKRSGSTSHDTLDTVVKNVEQLERLTKDTQLDLTSLKQKFDNLHERMIHLEAQSRRDNLLIDGIAEPEGETDVGCLQTVYLFFEKKLGISNLKEIKIVRCHRIGPKPEASNARNRSIIVKFHWFGDRMKVWSCRRNLKGSKIFLNEDFPREIVSCRKALVPCMKEARKHGHKAYITKDKLHIHYKNGGHSVYTEQTMNTLPPSINPYDMSFRKTEDCLAFFTKFCPLSNFYPCPLVIDGEKFKSTEQFYQHSKAIFANDEVSANRIMKAEFPAQCKSVGDRIKIDKTAWQAKCQDVTN